MNFDSYVFQAPKPLFNPERLKGELIWIPKYNTKESNNARAR